MDDKNPSGALVQNPYNGNLPHGSASRYQHAGCRCGPCTTAATIKQRDYRNRKKKLAEREAIAAEIRAEFARIDALANSGCTVGARTGPAYAEDAKDAQEAAA